MFVGTLTKYGLVFEKCDLIARLGGADHYEKFLRVHTVKENVVPGKFNMFAVKTLKPYKIEGDLIIFPKRFAALFGAVIQKLNILPHSHVELPSYEPSITFTNYQQVAISHVSETLPSIHAAYIKLGTGLGKTILGLGLIMNMRMKTMVVTPTIAIAQTWLDDAVLTCPELKIGMYDKKTTNAFDVVVIIVNTFCKQEEMFLDGYGMVVIDEAHEYHSPTRMDSLWLAQAAPYIVGLSATPDSASHGLDKIVYKFLGKPIDVITLPGCEVPDVSFTVKIKAIKYHGDPQYSGRVLTKGGTVSTVLTIGSMVRDASRMNLVVQEIRRLRSEGHGVMVFAEIRSYVAEIAKELAKYELGEIELQTDTTEASGTVVVNKEAAVINEAGTSGEKCSILQGGITSEQLASTKKAGAHVVLTTYGYSRRGVSLVEMTSLVLATPRKSNTIQIIGRILRRGSDMTKVREIVDIVDVNSGFQTQFTERNKIYSSQHYPVTQVTKKFTDSDIYRAEKPLEIDLEELMSLVTE